MMAQRTFAGLTATEWIAVAAVVSAFATIALVFVTIAYVRLTRRLVTATAAQLVAEFDVVLTAYTRTGYPYQGGPVLGPFPELIRITSLGTRAFVHGVHFDSGRGVPTDDRVASVEGDANFIDPSTHPARLARGETLYCGFEGGIWGLEDPGQEVAITIDCSLEQDGPRESRTYRVRISALRELPWK